jgi:hypothetical protein
VAQRGAWSGLERTSSEVVARTRLDQACTYELLKLRLLSREGHSRLFVEPDVQAYDPGASVVTPWLLQLASRIMLRCNVTDSTPAPPPA